MQIGRSPASLTITWFAPGQPGLDAAAEHDDALRARAIAGEGRRSAAPAVATPPRTSGDSPPASEAEQPEAAIPVPSRRSAAPR